MLRAVLRHQPGDAHGWFLLGACHDALGERPSTIEAFSRSLALNPVNAEAHLALISVFRASGDQGAALAACSGALARLPGEERLIYASGLCHEDVGETETALALYDTALASVPAFEDALHNRGLLLLRMKKFEDAIASQHRYIAAFPRSARAYSALVDALLAQSRYEDALAELESMTELADGDISVPVRKGVALSALGRFDLARIHFEAARAQDSVALKDYLRRVTPEFQIDSMFSPENIYLSRTWATLGQCEWTKWDGFVEQLRRAAQDSRIIVEPAVAFMCQHAPLSGVERHAIARHIATAIEERCPPLPGRLARGRQRIRIGVLSPDFREHLDAYLMLPLFELLDRRQFHIFAYSLSGNDGSAIRARVQAASDEFRELQALADRDAAQVIQSDGVDILLDVGGHSTGARFAITAQRPALVQASYLAFSCSLASTRLDYAIVDRTVGFDDSEWTEARVFLPGTYYLYDFRDPEPSVRVAREDYGLPKDALVYCVFHKPEKISPDVFDLWMQILARVPNSILWFRALSETAARNFRAQAAIHGIDPARLAFAPFEPRHDSRYLARHRLGDVMLDSLHHNAITTACDALGAGLPLITFPGNAFAARACESPVRAAGIPELVTSSEKAYVNTAVHLGANKHAHQAVKRRLATARRTAPLFDTIGRVRALEAAFREMVERAARGEPPASFDV